MFMSSSLSAVGAQPDASATMISPFSFRTLTSGPEKMGSDFSSQLPVCLAD